MKIRIFSVFFVILILFGMTVNSYSIERFPPPQFEGDYVRPEHTAPMPRGGAWPLIDAIVLLSALGVSSYLVHKKRSRKAVFSLMLFSLAYFAALHKMSPLLSGAITADAMASSAPFALCGRCVFLCRRARDVFMGGRVV